MTKIFPAIDIINGTCVRLTEGKETQKTDYRIKPIDMALQFEDDGAKYLHVVDLDAALGNGNNKKLIFDIAKNTTLKIQVGGGIRSEDDINQFLDQGISQCILGSIAVEKKAIVKQWINDFGAEKLVIGADMLGGKILTKGWKNSTDIDLDEFIIEYLEAGAQKFLCTDVSKDGKLNGSAIDLYKHLQLSFPTGKFLASGGVTSLEEIEQLKRLDLYGIIVGKAIYENTLSLKDILSI